MRYQFEEEHRWLVQNSKELEKHRGKWIAISKNKIIVSDKDLKKVYKRAPKALLFLVPRKGEENYVLWIRL